MNPDLNISRPLCTDAFEEAVNRFLDGDLPFAQQPQVFQHLAGCPDCRRLVDAVLRFRSVSRRERILVPPAVDEAFFQRLEQHKKKSEPARSGTGSVLNARRFVSLRTAVVAAVFLLSVGLLVPLNSNKDRARYQVRGVTEQVEFRDVIYVIYPGVTVEAAKVDL